MQYLIIHVHMRPFPWDKKMGIARDSRMYPSYWAGIFYRDNGYIGRPFLRSVLHSFLEKQQHLKNKYCNNYNKCNV